MSQAKAHPQQTFPTLLYKPQFITTNTSTTDPQDMMFFVGFEMVGFVHKPKFEPLGEDGRLDCRTFWDGDAAQAALDELLHWYDTEGVKWGDTKPDNLGIIA
jgi:hypothetical protein